MEPKKSPKADLQNKRGLFLQIGFVLVLGAVFAAFSGTREVNSVDLWENQASEYVEEIFLPTVFTEPPKPPVLPPPPRVLDVLNLVEDIKEGDLELNLDPDWFEPGTNFPLPLPPVTPAFTEAIPEPVVVAQIMPEFPGGEVALRAFLARNIKYPEVALQTGVSGKVYVRFVIETNGEVSSVQIARGVDPALDTEAIRVVSKLPKWRPGIQDGRLVRVTYTVPIHFQIQ